LIYFKAVDLLSEKNIQFYSQKFLTLATSSVIIDGVEGDKVSPQQSIQSFVTMNSVLVPAPASALTSICKSLALADKAIACNYLNLSGEGMIHIIRLLVGRTSAVPTLGIQFEGSALTLDKADVTVHFMDVPSGLRRSSLSFKISKFKEGLKTPASRPQIERFRKFYKEFKAELTVQVMLLDELGLLDRTK
jgi:hypothetical protein